MLIICTWLWGEKYGVDDVRKLRAGLNRHLFEQHRFICFSDRLFTLNDVEVAPILDGKLCLMPGCFARLRLFDPEFQDLMSLNESPSNRIVNIDLDSVITAQVDPLFPVDVDFMILQGGNAANPNPYVGALFMLRPGVHPEVWRSFSLEAAKQIPFHEYPDDQGWLWHMVPNAPGWKAGESGVYVFQKPGWPPGQDLPRNARMVTFTGWRKPNKFKHLYWVQQHWRA